MERQRCPIHELVIGDGGCLRCGRDDERPGGKRLLPVLLATVALVIVAMASVRAVTSMREPGAATLSTAEATTSDDPKLPTSPTASTATGLAVNATGTTTTGDRQEREQRITAEAKNVPVTLYSADYCPWCRKAKAHMDARGISYTERDVDRNPAAKRDMQRIGGRGIPTIDIEGDVHSGFDPNWVERTIRAHAERRIATLQ